MIGKPRVHSPFGRGKARFGESLTWLTTSFLVALLLTACGPELIFEEAYELPAGTWTYADSVVFAYEIVDTSRSYDLVLDIHHRDVFATQNLYGQFTTVYPNGTRQTEPLSLELADNSGQWLGECAGEDCTLTLPLQVSTRYPAAGRYEMVVRQFMRRDSVEGVSGFGLRIVVADVTEAGR